MLIVRQKGASCRRYATACPGWCEERLESLVFPALQRFLLSSGVLPTKVARQIARSQAAGKSVPDVKLPELYRPSAEAP